MLLDERVYDTILYYMVSAYILCAQELASFIQRTEPGKQKNYERTYTKTVYAQKTEKRDVAVRNPWSKCCGRKRVGRIREKMCVSSLE